MMVNLCGNVSNTARGKAVQEEFEHFGSGKRDASWQAKLKPSMLATGEYKCF